MTARGKKGNDTRKMRNAPHRKRGRKKGNETGKRGRKKGKEKQQWKKINR